MQRVGYTIIILGGLLRKTKGKWRTGRFNYIRVLAGYYLYNKLSKDYKTNLIVSGGKGIYKSIPGMPTVSKVMKQELINLGLSSKKIIEENKASNTYRELLWIKKNRKISWGKVIIISNKYHLPRIKTMLKFISSLESIRKYAKILSAEIIVINKDKKWKNKINIIYKSPAMKKIIANEKRGILHLKRGNYKLK